MLCSFLSVVQKYLLGRDKVDKCTEKEQKALLDVCIISQTISYIFALILASHIISFHCVFRVGILFC